MSSNDILRVPLPGSTNSESGANLEFGVFSCSEIKLISNDGASGLAYEGVSRDYYGAEGAAPARLIIKECYPIEIANSLRREGSSLVLDPGCPLNDTLTFAKHVQAYKDAFVRHTSIYQGAARESVSVPSRTREANGTVYLVCDVSNGHTLDKVVADLSLHSRVQIVVNLARTLSLLHSENYVYLDLKPDNVLITEASGFVTGVRLFDFDSTAKLEDLENKTAVISGSDGWSSYEQMHEGHLAEVSLRSDFYSIGALLFWLLTGRISTYTEVIHAYGEWKLTTNDFSAELGKLSDKFVDAVNAVLSKTLTASPVDRYESDEDLLAALKNLCDLCEPASEPLTESIDEASRAIKTDLKEKERKKKHDRRLIAAIVISTLLVCVIGFGLLIYAKNLSTEEPIVGTWDVVAWVNANNEEVEADEGSGTLQVSKDGTVALTMDGTAISFNWVKTSYSDGTTQYDLLHNNSKVGTLYYNSSDSDGQYVYFAYDMLDFKAKMAKES